MASAKESRRGLREWLPELGTPAAFVGGGAVWAPAGRFNALEDKLDQRVNALEDKFDQRVNALEDKVEHRAEARYNALLEQINARFDKLETSLQGLDERIRTNSEGIAVNRAILEERAAAEAGNAAGD